MQQCNRLLHTLCIQPFGLQLVADARRPQPTCAAVYDRLDHPLLVDEAFGLQFIKHTDQLAGRLLEGAELSLELGS